MPRNRHDDEEFDESPARSRHEGCCEGSCHGRHGWHHKWSHRHHHSHGGALYGLGVVGAAVFFLQQSSGFWPGALAILKAFFWPAFLVYKAMGLLGL